MQFPSEARAAARQAEREPCDRPLHGVPVTIKDSFDIRDLPTLCGSRFRLAHRAPADVDCRRLGFGRPAESSLARRIAPSFLANWESDNYITGRTNNPWDIERTAGGSSGGESAAIAAFFSAGGVGSDGGGSIRVPAHFSGICGLKPTPGASLPPAIFLKSAHPGGLLGVAGPMARTVGDVRLLFEVLAGYDPADPFSAPVPLRRDVSLDGCIGVMEQFLDVPVENAMREAVQKAARLLASCGFEVDDYRPPAWREACDTWWFFFGELPSPFTRELWPVVKSDAHWTGTELFGMTDPRAVISGRTVVEKLGLRDRMRAALLRQMERFPVLLLPVCCVAAFPHRQRHWQDRRPGSRDSRYHGAGDAMESARHSWSGVANGLLVGGSSGGRATRREALSRRNCCFMSGVFWNRREVPFPSPPGFDVSTLLISASQYQAAIAIQVQLLRTSRRNIATTSDISSSPKPLSISRFAILFRSGFKVAKVALFRLQTAQSTDLDWTERAEPVKIPIEVSRFVLAIREESCSMSQPNTGLAPSNRAPSARIPAPVPTSRTLSSGRTCRSIAIRQSRVAACVPLPQAIPGCILQPQSSFRGGVVAPVRDQIESLSNRERLPLILRETNPILVFFLVNGRLEIGKFPEQDLSIRLGTEEGS